MQSKGTVHTGDAVLQNVRQPERVQPLLLRALQDVVSALDGLASNEGEFIPVGDIS